MADDREAQAAIAGRHPVLIHLQLAIGEPLPDPTHSSMVFEQQDLAPDGGPPPFLDWSERHPDGSRTLKAGGSDDDDDAIDPVSLRISPAELQLWRNRLIAYLEHNDPASTSVDVGANDLIDWSYYNGEGLTMLKIGEHRGYAIGTWLTDGQLDELSRRLNHLPDSGSGV
jgi:hypothetical protein